MLHYENQDLHYETKSVSFMSECETAILLVVYHSRSGLILRVSMSQSAISALAP